jgi:hypothetical protein
MSHPLPKPDAAGSFSRLRRRQFISTAMFAGAGLTIASGPQDAFASSEPDMIPTLAELLPKPADSLAHYTELYLSRIELTILREYFAIVGSLVCQLKLRYDHLLRDTKELERAVPHLKDTASQIKGMTDMGRTNAVQLEELARASVVAVNSPSSMIAFSLISLKNSVADWDSETRITLSGPAVALLGSIIKQIKELEPLVKNLSDTSALLTDADNKLKKDISAIREKLEDAVGNLTEADNLKFPVPLPPPPPDISANVLNQISSGGPAAIDRLTNSAVTSITEAIAQLLRLDALKPGAAILGDLYASVLAIEPKCRGNAALSAKIPLSEQIPMEPTQNLRELLQMVIDWIHKGGLAAPAQQPCMNKGTTTSFVPVSLRSSSAFFGGGVWYQIRWVLQWFLPQDSWRRAAYCSFHIVPVLFNPNPDARYRKIYQILPDLIPTSIVNLYDSKNDAIRVEAAKRFSQIRP